MKGTKHTMTTIIEPDGARTESVIPAAKHLLHKHLMIHGKCKKSLDSEQECDVFLTNLVKTVNMEVLAPARSKFCHDPNNYGVSGDILLTTSSACIHFWSAEKPFPDFQLDIYSCSNIPLEEVWKYLDQFDMVSAEYCFLDRENNFVILDKGNKEF